MKTSVSRVPIIDLSDTNENRIKEIALRMKQPLDNIVVIPFYELEGMIDTKDVFTPVIEEPSVLGEKLADELEGVSDSSHFFSVIATPMTHIVGEEESNIATIIDSPETMTKLENIAQFGE